MKGKSLPLNHPLRKARWIWPNCNIYLHNCFARFRHDFTISTMPEKAPLFITADKSYRLYINGRYVCRGPARGYQSHWPFDEVDVKDFLKEGRNWISVDAYNPGISTFQYLHKTKAGLLCAAEWKDVSIHTSEQDGTWNFGRSPGHSTETAMLTKQMEFQEHFDASRDDRAWIYSPDFKDSLAKDDPYPSESNGCPFGQPPYDNVEPRGIPLLREEIIIPKAFLRHGEGTSSKGYRDCKNITWHFSLDEMPGVKEWRDAAELKTERSAEALKVEMPAAGKGRLSAISLDLGENHPGNLIAEINGAQGVEIIDFHYQQFLEDGIPQFVKPYASQVALSSRLRLAKGHCKHEFHHLTGCRHVTMVVYDSATPLQVKLSWRRSVYPFTMAGKFSCSDETLNHIHDICRRTQQICSLDAYVDTPWREQGQYWGDARIQIKNTIHLDGDMSLTRRGIRSIAEQDAPFGLTYGLAPTCSGTCILPDFSLTWILTIWDYYWQTGDLKIFHEQHARIKKIFRYFERKELRTQDGLLLNDKRFWLFEDWGTLPKDPIPSFLNLWDLYTLEHYAKLLLASGLKGEAAKVATEIETRRKLLAGKLFNLETGLFNSCLDLDGNPTAEASVHDQVLALLLNLRPEAKKYLLKKRILPFAKGEKLSCATPSSFWAAYFIECLASLGYKQEAIDFIRTRWSPMIPTGTTWEVFDLSGHPAWSRSHAWSAHPCYHLTNMLAGLRQTGVAWSEVEWSPCPAEGISHAEATIPTPKGMLRASWKKTANGLEGEIEVPKGMEILAKLPGCKAQTLRQGIHRLKA